MSRSTCLSVAGLCGCLLVVLASVPGWPLLAADVEESDVELKLVEGGPGGFANSIGMKFVLVRPGKFKMGAPANEQGAAQEEKPQHQAEITKEYYLAAHEVTQKQYKAVMGATPSAFSKTGGRANTVMGLNTDDFPVDSVSWPDADDFIKKLNALAAEKQYRVKYRLPTEAEWEYACRGGHLIEKLEAKQAEMPFHFKKPSASLSFGQANFSAETPYGGGKRGAGLNRTCPVGKYQANALGLSDMHGNLWEWCADYYVANVYSEKNRKDPKGPNNGQGRVIRGGSWGNAGDACRAARRLGYGPDSRSEYVGFRVACVRQD